MPLMPEEVRKPASARPASISSSCSAIAAVVAWCISGAQLNGKDAPSRSATSVGGPVSSYMPVMAMADPATLTT
ncbi:hypothetical protein [Nocardioides houyundeii]|uniref:hypothetical protein n=1 Tax=Nocardioides houyundeii TaxID=2045452 RepID=UPI0013150609|nr:hypothetical protein [Nocardioides houyundeii]